METAIGLDHSYVVASPIEITPSTSVADIEEKKQVIGFDLESVTLEDVIVSEDVVEIAQQEDAERNESHVNDNKKGPRKLGGPSKQDCSKRTIRPQANKEAPSDRSPTIDIDTIKVKTYKCMVCSKEFYNKKYAQAHRKVHGGKEIMSVLCSLCKKGFKSERLLDIHMKVHIEERPHKCDVCDAGFLEYGNLMTHMRTHGGPHTCSHCGKVLMRRDRLARHIRSFHTPKKLFVCDICGKKCKYEYCLRSHKATHGGLRYTCGVCDKEFAYKGIFLLHMETHHTEPAYQCVLCEELFSSEMKLVNHTKMHNDGQSMVCDICLQEFDSNLVLLEHRRMHTRAKPHLCIICHEGFSDLKSLTMHLKEHDGPSRLTRKPHECKQCGERFRNGFQLAIHRKQHKVHACDTCGGEYPSRAARLRHKRIDRCATYICEVCGKVFNRSKNLREHRVVHQVERPLSCDLCEKTFKSKAHLRTHKRRHKGGVYVCETCGKGFSLPSRLKEHNRIHTGERNYSCNVCGKSYTMGSTLNRHRLRNNHHEEVPHLMASLMNETPGISLVNAGANTATNSNQAQTATTNKSATVASAERPGVSGATSKVTPADVDQAGGGESDFTSGQEKMLVLAIDNETASGSSNHRGLGDVIFMCSFCGMQFNKPDELTAHMAQHPEDAVPVYGVRGNDLNAIDDIDEDSAAAENIPVIGQVYSYDASTNMLILNQSLAQPQNDAQDSVTIVSDDVHESEGHDKSTYVTIVSDEVPDGSEDPEIKKESTKHICDICLKECQSKLRLMVHMRTHEFSLRPPSGTPHVLQRVGDKPYKCNICHRSFNLVSGLRHHMTIHSNKPYGCLDCPKQFDTAAGLTEHMLKGHPHLHRYACMECPALFKSARSLNAHSEMHSKGDNLSCYICRVGCGSPQELVEHLKDHSIRALHRCDKCNKEFKSQIYFEIHMKNHSRKKGIIQTNEQSECSPTDVVNEETKDSETIEEDIAEDGDVNRESDEEKEGQEKPYSCGICKLEFAKIYNLHMHAKLHLGIRKWACQVCGKKFQRKSHLITHTRVHTGERPFVCDICGAAFADHRGLKRHRARHGRTGKKVGGRRLPGDPAKPKERRPRRTRVPQIELPPGGSLACPMCGKVLANRKTLMMHIKHHSERRPYVCEVCHGGFVLPNELKRHMEIHGDRRFQCQYCDKAFTTPRSHRIHELTHVRPFRCEECDKVFSKKSRLKEHSRLHTGERPYVCAECGRGYISSGDLSKHRKSCTKVPFIADGKSTKQARRSSSKKGGPATKSAVPAIAAVPIAEVPEVSEVSEVSEEPTNQNSISVVSGSKIVVTTESDGSKVIVIQSNNVGNNPVVLDCAQLVDMLNL